MALINPKITLLIAEQLGASDISSLMLTCKANYTVIKNDEKAIAQAMIRRMDLDLVSFLSIPVLGDPALPIIAAGPSLASPARVFDQASFELVAELERRAQGADNYVALSMLLSGWAQLFADPLSYR